ncbi:MAG: glycosyltransferase family 2 protein [Candidatus Omnitrophica bacterium]|nr:glycosyltransferase family 2 protein [Candidatus Omnitrophota bacterium]
MNIKETLSVIVPVFNEASNLESNIEDLIDILNRKFFDWQLILVNDGSCDGTAEIINKLVDKYKNIEAIHNNINKGVGYSLRKGIEKSTKNIITWIPADGENDLDELINYIFLLDHVDFIVPFVINVGVRSWMRNFLSRVYLYIVNIVFGTTFNYTNGTIVYKRFVLENIILMSNSSFIHAEGLIKSIRSGFIYAEVPVHLKKRGIGESKTLTIKSFDSIIWDFVKLFSAIYGFKNLKKTRDISKIKEDVN